MSLFQFGVRRASAASQDQPSQDHSSESLPTHMQNLEESGLGRVEFEHTLESGVGSLAYTAEQRASIGKYALENGNERARRHFSSLFPNMSESTVRNFKKAYTEKLQQERKQPYPQPVVQIPAQPRGRPPLLLELDEKLIKYLRAIRSKGGVVNIHVVRAATRALIESNPTTTQQLLKFDMPRSWVYSIYKRMGFTRRMGTTTRPPVLRGLYNECRREYLGDVKEITTKYNIPPELVINADQTPSSYVSVGRSTMAARGSTSVPIKGLTDKRNITLTFVISLSGEFLPLQVIYSGKTTASHPRGFKFPVGFSISQNPKHWSNKQETD